MIDTEEIDDEPIKLTKTEKFYGNQSFKRLRDLDCFSVYNCHINMLEEQLAIYTQQGEYNLSYGIQKSIEHFRELIQQAKDN